MENQLVSISSGELHEAITQYEEKILNALQIFGLPTDKIFASVNERKRVYTNAGEVVLLLPQEQRKDAIYVSKFLAAVGAGLFDAALNYLWDETIVQLRSRVSQYDIQYFYDLAVTAPDKRSRLATLDDLLKLDDSELIKGAREIGLISDIGYKHLDYIKYMRNWASAAHPNLAELSGLQLIAWLETCINEVICLPVTNVTIEIKKLLRNIKANTITQNEAETIGAFFYTLPDDKANSLASGLFGIYTRKESLQSARQNIQLLAPLLWDRVSESVKSEFGTKYAQFAACSDQKEAKLARNFLQVVGGEQYIPDTIRSAEIKSALDNLLIAHNGVGNFYSEPSFASHVKRLVGDSILPPDLDIAFARSIVYVYITNGNGVCWEADKIYSEMITNFNQKQTHAAIMSFLEDSISSKLQFSLCASKFLEMIKKLEPKVFSPPLLEMINLIKKYQGDLSDIRRDPSIKQKSDALKILLK